MQLNKIGLIAEKMWQEIPFHFPFVDLDAFVVMPNHIHGIVIIKRVGPFHAGMAGTLHPGIVGTLHPGIVGTLHPGIVGTLHATSLPSADSTPLKSDDNTSVKNKMMSLISPSPGSLSVVIRSYKSAVTRHVHSIDAGFSWQPRFYDTIICSNDQVNRIRNYINGNPCKWADDGRKPESF